MTNISGAVRHGRRGTAEWTSFGACDEASDMELVPTKGGMPMFGPMRKALAALCTAALLFGALSLPVRAEDEGPAIDFLSYEDALKYFDFDHAASNWCGKFGLDPATQLEEAKRELLSGTDPRLIIGLADAGPARREHQHRPLPQLHELERAQRGKVLVDSRAGPGLAGRIPHRSERVRHPLHGRERILPRGPAPVGQRLGQRVLCPSGLQLPQLRHRAGREQLLDRRHLRHRLHL